MFSRRTIIQLIKILDFSTHNKIDLFIFEFEIENDKISSGSKPDREISIIKYLYENPELKGPNGANLTFEIIEYAIKPYKDKRYGGFESLIDRHPEFVNSLNRDGFELTDNGLKRTFPEVLPIVEQEDQLISLLNEYGFVTAKGHYEQAVAAHTRGDWAGANGQLRTFVEEFFNKTQEIVCPGEYASSNERKIALAKNGFFIQSYNEYLYNGKGFVEGFWKRLCPEGSHPGLSEQADSTFRLHLVILVVHYFLSRIASKCSVEQ